MPLPSISPTKSNYLRIRERLRVARDGCELLEQKRQILVMELVRYLESAGRVKTEVASSMASAYEELRAACEESGVETLGRQSCGIVFEHKMKISVVAVS